MKKILLIVCLLCLGILIYFISRSATDKDEKKFTDIQSPLIPTVVSKIDKPSIAPIKTTETVSNEDKNFNEYDSNEKAWLSQIDNVLGKEDFTFYLGLRERNEAEKMKAYQEFHDYLRQKNGDNFSYNISEDQSIREKEINTKYTREFLKKIGEEKFGLYLKARDQFNSELQRKSHGGQALVIEF
jgi:hypothetical protein